MNDILPIILNETYTQTQLKRRLRLLKAYIDSRLFSSGQKLVEQDSYWISSLGESFYQNFTKENFHNLFEKIEKQIDALNLLIVYLPIELPDKEIPMLGKKVRLMFNQVSLIEIKLDPTLIAGCALIFGGLYKDYSIRSKIQEKRMEILSTLKGFLR